MDSAFYVPMDSALYAPRVEKLKEDEKDIEYWYNELKNMRKEVSNVPQLILAKNNNNNSTNSSNKDNNNNNKNHNSNNNYRIRNV